MQTIELTVKVKDSKEAVKQKYRFFSFGDSMLIGDFDNE